MSQTGSFSNAEEAVASGVAEAEVDEEDVEEVEDDAEEGAEEEAEDEEEAEGASGMGGAMSVFSVARLFLCGGSSRGSFSASSSQILAPFNWANPRASSKSKSADCFKSPSSFFASCIWERWRR